MGSETVIVMLSVMMMMMMKMVNWGTEFSAVHHKLTLVHTVIRYLVKYKY